MKKTCFIICLILLAFNFSGCWSRIEVEDLAIASAVGIDKGETEEFSKILFSVLVVRPENVQGGSGDSSGTGGTGEGGSQAPGWVNFGQGNSVDDARRNLSTTTSKRIFLGHSRVIILGEEKAKEGVGDIVDYLIRNEEIRLRSWLLVTSAGTALETLSLNPELSNTFSDEVDNFLTISAPRASKSYAVNVKNFMVDLTTTGKEAVLPLLEIRTIPPGETTPSGGSQAGGPPQPKKNARLKGLAVFRGDKMVGELGDSETKGFLWIAGKAQRGTLAFRVDNSGVKEPAQVTVEMTRVASKIKTDIVQGKPVVKLKIETEGDIGEFSGTDVKITPEDIELVNQGYRKAIEEQVMLALNKCQKELQADIFGFGTYVHRQQLRYWKEHNLEKKWPEVFPEIQVQVEIKANVRRTGLIQDSIKVE
jgi:spore germination protein KC